MINYIASKNPIFESVKITGDLEVEENIEVEGNIGVEGEIDVEDLELTFRRDEENNRPRANKENSHLDREQKSKGKLYYL